jgi:phosphate:Na+ symporter
MLLTTLIIVGGQALFLVGMRMLSQGMEQLAGGKLQHWLERATDRRVKAAAFGAVATAALQSSTLLMITMIGLVNGGLMTLTQAIGMMLGQEIGTTITGQIIAFDIGFVRYVAIAVGYVLVEFGRKRSLQRYGTVLLGFGLMFTGMNMMMSALEPLAETPGVANWLAAMSQTPILAMLAGAALTALIRASSATTALAIALGTADLITLPGAIGIILGANVGTCVTGFIASLGTSVAARRVSIAQILINVIGVLIFLPLIAPYAQLLQGTASALPRQIANAHTVFNVAVSALLFPFVRQIERLTAVIVPERPGVAEERVTRFIDDGLRGVPAIAIGAGFHELDYMGQTALGMLEDSRAALLDLDMARANNVIRLERQVLDPLCDSIESFVNGVIAEDLAEEERQQCFRLKSVNVDLERVGDHTENLAEAAQDRINHHVLFSAAAIQDLNGAFAHVHATLSSALEALGSGDRALAERVRVMEDEMDRINLATRQRHMDRIQDGNCDPEASLLFVEALRNLERISDHADNLADSVLAV